MWSSIASVLEEDERSTNGEALPEVKEGDVISGTRRSLTEYGAFG